MSRIYLDGEVWFCSEHPDPDACDCPRPPPVPEGTPRMLLRCACRDGEECLACTDDPRPIPAAEWEKKYRDARRKFWADWLGARGELEFVSADPCGANASETSPASERVEDPPVEVETRTTYNLKPWTGQVFDQRQLPEPFKCSRCGRSFCACELGGRG